MNNYLVKCSSKPNRAWLTWLLAMSMMAFSLLSYSQLADTTVTYQQTSEDIMNPDRGFYYPYTTSSSQFTPLTVAELKSRRDTPYTPFQGNYTVRSSLAFRHYVLDSLANQNTIPASLLDKIQDDFDIAREAGVRLILRFSYTITPVAGSCAAGFICPPYGDAPKARVLGHIAQLTPLLEANYDVISSVQQGFIGTWGENYYTDHFGDSSVNADQGYLTNQNWSDRNEIVSALLDSIPQSRMVQLRYPQSKQRYLGGVNAALSFPAITTAQAHTGREEARLGFHNDCLLASEDDFGTFADYGNDQNPVSSSNTDVLVPYAQDDGKYVAVGGETCSDAYSPQNNCASQGGNAVALLESFSYSYLNSDYNNQVNNDWQDGGCMQTIKQRLGYRFSLTSGKYPTQVKAGQMLGFTLGLKNSGFSTPYNERATYLVLRAQNAQEHRLKLSGANSDSRFWEAGRDSDLSFNVLIPASVPAGDYDLLLHISDESNGGIVANRAEYSIRLANEQLWEPTTGYNKLNHSLVVLAADEPVGDIRDDDILMFLPAILATPSLKKTVSE